MAAFRGVSQCCEDFCWLASGYCSVAFQSFVIIDLARAKSEAPINSIFII